MAMLAALLLPALLQCPPARAANVATVADAANIPERGKEQPLRRLAGVTGMYLGLIGTRRVQVELGPHPDEPQRLAGTYFFFGDGAVIQLVGEIEDDELVLEESRNGVDVSGTWEGRIEPDRLVGTWASPDDKLTLPFTLKRVSAFRKP